MRIAVISDIHANIIALQAVVNHINEQGIDEIIFLGDLLFNGPHPKETMEKMRELSPLIWIRGNTDKWLCEVKSDFVPETEREKHNYALYQYTANRLSTEDMEALASKQDSCQVEIEGVKILCVHGSNNSNSEPIGIMTSKERIEQITDEIDSDILFCGHTHLPYISLNGKKIINVGAVSLSNDGEATASYGVLDIQQGVADYTNFQVTYNIEEVINDGIKNEFPYLERYARKLTEAR